MSVFSFSWFKANKRKEQLEELLVEEQRIKNQILTKQLLTTKEEKASDEIYVVGIDPYEEEEIVNEMIPENPYLKLKLVNDTLIVVLHDGSIISKSGATVEDFNLIKNLKTEEDIFDIIGSPEGLVERKAEEKEKIKMEALQKGIDLLLMTKEFTVEDGSVFLTGINRTLPQSLVEKFIFIVNAYLEGGFSETEMINQLIVDEEYQGLKRFFMWCCLNPRAEVANDLYNFLDKNGMKITKQGMFVALRNVIEVGREGNDDLVHFISNAYNKIKAVWKKSPAKYNIHKGSEGYYMMGIPVAPYDASKDKSYIGNLKDLYLDLPNMQENKFTDSWTRTFDIRIGRVVSMPMKECDWSTRDCYAAGLHFAGYTAPYVLLGDTTVFVLINPMSVVGIGNEKGRCYEYLPFMTTNVKEADEIMNDGDFDFLQLDEDYAIRELQTLEEKAQAGFVAETSKHQFNLPAISFKEIHNIITSLKEMKKEISERITLIH